MWLAQGCPHRCSGHTARGFNTLLPPSGCVNSGGCNASLYRSVNGEAWEHVSSTPASAHTSVKLLADTGDQALLLLGGEECGVRVWRTGVEQGWTAVKGLDTHRVLVGSALFGGELWATGTSPLHLPTPPLHLP